MNRVPYPFKTGDFVPYDGPHPPVLSRPSPEPDSLKVQRLKERVAYLEGMVEGLLKAPRPA